MEPQGRRHKAHLGKELLHCWRGDGATVTRILDILHEGWLAKLGNYAGLRYYVHITGVMAMFFLNRKGGIPCLKQELRIRIYMRACIHFGKTLSENILRTKTPPL